MHITEHEYKSREKQMKRKLRLQVLESIHQEAKRNSLSTTQDDILNNPDDLYSESKLNVSYNKGFERVSPVRLAPPQYTAKRN